MAEARGRDNWAHTSAILALMANVNRDPKRSRVYKPADFDPYQRRQKRDDALEIKSLGFLKEGFSPKRQGKKVTR